MEKNFDMWELGISPQQIELYFEIDKWLKKWKWGAAIFLLVAIAWYWLEIHEGHLIFEIPYFWVPAILGVLCIVRIVKMRKNCPEDSDIDETWDLQAFQRYDEAMSQSHIEGEDLAGPEGEGVDHFFGWPAETFPGMPYRGKIGKDGLYRSNYQQLVFVLYGKDALMQFDEAFNLEYQHDGKDQTREFYWTDIAGITFDQREEIFSIIAAGKEETFNLNNSEGQHAYKSDRAEAIAKTCRTMLRQKKRGNNN